MDGRLYTAGGNGLAGGPLDDETTMTGYPPVGAWFYPWPAQRGEAHLHRVRGYHVDDQARALLVDGDCGIAFTAGVAVLVPDPGADDLLCGRCRWPGQDPRPARPGHRRPHRRPALAPTGSGASGPGPRTDAQREAVAHLHVVAPDRPSYLAQPDAGAGWRPGR